MIDIFDKKSGAGGFSACGLIYIGKTGIKFFRHDQRPEHEATAAVFHSAKKNGALSIQCAVFSCEETRIPYLRLSSFICTG